MLVEISMNLFQIASLEENLILAFWQYKLVWYFKGVCFLPKMGII